MHYWCGEKQPTKVTMAVIQTACPTHIDFHEGKQEMHSAEVGTLAPLFEKSATEFKSKPQLFDWLFACFVYSV